MARQSIQGIYKIKNLINGKIYIGQSIDVERRIREHYKYFMIPNKWNAPLYNAFKKYGETSFDFSLIEVVTDSLKLDDRE